MLLPLLASALCHATALDARYVMLVADVPVAELRVRVEGRRYVYESRHFLEEGPRERRVELTLEGAGPLPEVLVLSRRPAPGCREVLEERRRTTEVLCVDAGDGAEVTGTLDGQRFQARYGASGALEEIHVASSTWRAVAQPARAPAQSPFVRGVPLPKAVHLELQPPVEGARWLPTAPRGVGREGRAGRTRCLPLAREELGRRPGATVSVGLVVERGVAYPHAWVTTPEGPVDPSVLPGDPGQASRRYLEVPPAQAGRFFLDFFDGATRLVPRGP